MNSIFKISKLVILFGIFITSCNPYKVYWYKEINSKAFNEKIYINCIGLGATGDHRIIKISKKKDKNNVQRENEFYLNSYSSVLYKFSNDTLFILSEEPFKTPIRDSFKTPIVFTIIDTKDYQNGKYKQNGFSQISPYKEINIVKDSFDIEF